MFGVPQEEIIKNFLAKKFQTIPPQMLIINNKYIVPLFKIKAKGKPDIRYQMSEI
jgi:hypothetical protein